MVETVLIEDANVVEDDGDGGDDDVSDNDDDGDDDKENPTSSKCGFVLTPTRNNE